MTTGLEVMPTTGGDFSVTDGEAGWKSAFDPETEIVKPGYHKLFLEKYANRFTLSLLKQHRSRDSMAMKRRACGWNEHYMLEILTGTTT
jgi:hypothetical protein